ncbi:MAG: prepilin-type N-terminal cleavage/methylation domain-containing protein [Haliea sp.]|nr:MAG: prepilin-type N-terminal cleavage/methylation domain-containing protein [Haliea sp.]
MHRLQAERVLEMTPLPHRSSGFTLIEILVTLTLLSVLMMVAVPSFVGFKRNSELTSAANSFIGAIATARGEAMKRSVTTMVVPVDGSWANGWLVFVDSNFDSSYDASTDILIATNAEALPAYFSMSKTDPAGYVKYNGSGYSVVDSGFKDTTIEIKRTDLTGAELLKQTRRIKVNATGRARVCTPASSSDATCAASGD